jgi:hypothetical protein
MKKIIISGIVAGVILLIVSEIVLHLTLLLFPSIAVQYFDPAFDTGSKHVSLYYLHPFVISLALAWFWTRFKGVLTGSFINRGIEFGLIYVGVASVPMLWLIYAAMNVSLAIVATWFVLALLQGIIAGLIFEKLNP